MDAARSICQATAATQPSDAAGATDTLLRRLLVVFSEKLLHRALAIVEQGGVACVTGDGTRRVLYQVRGHDEGVYTVLGPSHFCGCQAFMYDTVNKSEQLATLLAVSLGRVQEYEVSDLELSRLLEHGLDA